MKSLSLATFLLSALLMACSEPGEPSPLEISGFALSSEEPARLAGWYEANLGFITNDSAEQTEMSLGEFNMLIAPAETETKPAARGTRQPGLFKIGFKTPDLDGLYKKLQSTGSSFRGEVFYDQNLQTRSLVALDADGNRVQFFEDSSASGLKPYFFSVMALDFEATRAWCESTLGMEEIHQLDLPSRGLLIRLMAKDNVLLELISDERIAQDGSYMAGIEAIHFNRSERHRGPGELRYNPL